MACLQIFQNSDLTDLLIKKNLSGIQENADNLLTLISGIDTMQLYFVRDDV